MIYPFKRESFYPPRVPPSPNPIPPYPPLQREDSICSILVFNTVNTITKETLSYKMLNIKKDEMIQRNYLVTR